jgi:hypothetical protein
MPSDADFDQFVRPTPEVYRESDVAMELPVGPNRSDSTVDEFSAGGFL